MVSASCASVPPLKSLGHFSRPLLQPLERVLVSEGLLEQVPGISHHTSPH